MPEYNSTTIATTTKWRRSIRWHCASCKSKFLLTIFHDFTLDFQVKKPFTISLVQQKVQTGPKETSFIQHHLGHTAANKILPSTFRTDMHYYNCT
jgi:hypothetical protein